MMHYDEHLDATTYFRPNLKRLVNTVLDTNFEPIGTLRLFYTVGLHDYLGFWSFSFKTLIVSYIIMIAIGLSGMYVPTGLFILLSLFVIPFMKKAVILAILAHGFVLGLIISLLAGNLLFIIPVVLLVLLARLLIDVPLSKQIENIKKMYDNLGMVYGHGYSMPMERKEHLIDCVKYLQEYELKEARTASAYALGHHTSGDKEHSPEQVMDFIEDLLKECVA